MKTWKRTFFLFLCTLALLALTACAGKCKMSGCDDKVYKDGLCEFHYGLQVAGDAVKGIFGGLFG
ncbi:MAG: hypothetical protein J1E06_06815 [Acutalibacter sp.]|nr:hypothetical protein [Acutalibacter sp.]